MILAEDEILDMAAEIRVAALAFIDLRHLCREEARLGLFHRGEDRRVAGQVLVHADAEIELFAARVGPERGHQAEQRVRREGGETSEMRHGEYPVCVAGRVAVFGGR